jgi:hypothetical protein
MADSRFVEVTDKHISKIKINSAQKKHKKPVYEHTKTIIRVMLARFTQAVQIHCIYYMKRPAI